MESVCWTESIVVVGVELRTTNRKAFDEIPLHWQKFFQESILDQIPNKVSRDIYGVYTNFENEGRNNEGIYSFILGARVRSHDQVPTHFVSTVIPKSKRRVFQVATGQPEKVGEKWQEIWERTDLKKTFVSDYEHYQESGEIHIFVGIE